MLSIVAFEAVARHGSFSRAGRELHVTQGAISHRIRALEAEVGATLLVRTSRKVRLTEAGQILLRASVDALNRLRAGLAEVEAASDTGRVIVSCSPSFAIRWLVPHLGDLRRVAPEVDVHVSAADELVEPRVGAIDVCIRFGAGDYAGVTCEKLVAESITPVCSPLFLEQNRLREPRDLLACRLLHDDVLVDHLHHVGWTEYLAAADVACSHPTGVRFSHSHLALDAAASGQGAALARRALIRRQLEAGQLVTPFAFALPSELTYWLVTPKAPAPRRSTMRFVDWLRRALREEHLEPNPPS